MKTAIILTVGLILGVARGVSAAPADTARAFEHYEAIRVALAADTVKGIAEHATALAPIAATVAGADAKKHAELVAKAGDLKTARQHFGPLSAALLPAFEKAGMKDVYFYNCSMVEQSWAQRGKAIENPYMGKGMLACGVPAKAAK
jgi:membrane fusion protein, copper/silver efflux system